MKHPLVFAFIVALLAVPHVHSQPVTLAGTGGEPADTPALRTLDRFAPVFRAAEALVPRVSRVLIEGLDFQTQTLRDQSETLVTYQGGEVHQIVRRTLQGDPPTLQNWTRTTYAFANGLTTSEIWETWENGAWVNDDATFYTYTDGRPTSVLDQEWVEGAWVDSERTQVTYEGELFSQAVVEEWNGSAWVNRERSTMTDDGSDTIETEEEWDGSAWFNVSRTIYTDITRQELFDRLFALFLSNPFFDEGFEATLHLFMLASVEQEWVDDAWQNTSRIVFEPSVLGAAYPETITMDEWNPDTEAWESDTRMLIAWEDTEGTGTIQTQSLVVRTSKVEWQAWDEESNDWMTSLESDYTYNPDGTLAVVEMGGRFDPNAPLVLFSRTSYEYTDVPSSVEREVPASFVLDQNRPNPFNPSTAIRFELPVAGPATLRVYDLLGREVAMLFDGVRPAGEQTVTFDAGSLPGGVYLYRLEAGGYWQTRAMVLIK